MPCTTGPSAIGSFRNFTVLHSYDMLDWINVLQFWQVTTFFLILCSGCLWYFYHLKNESENVIENVKNVFLDLGANECQGLTHFINRELKITPSWEIHTFEPNPLINLEKCIKKFPKHNITTHQKAVWIRNDTIIFKQYGSKGTSQGSLLQETNGGKSYQDYYGETKVECIDIFDFVKSFDSRCHIYIKMDVEWAEYEILKYMLERGWPENIRKIWVEWHNTEDPQFKIKSENLTKEIEELGTKVINWH